MRIKKSVRPSLTFILFSYSRWCRPLVMVAGWKSSVCAQFIFNFVWLFNYAGAATTADFQLQITCITCVRICDNHMLWSCYNVTKRWQKLFSTLVIYYVINCNVIFLNFIFNIFLRREKQCNYYNVRPCV